MLAFDDVTRRFRNGAGVERLSLRVEPGEIVALVGLNGAGKTTLMRLALRMLRAQQGTVRLFDRPVQALPAGTWAQVGALVENPLAYPELTVGQNLRITQVLRGSGPEQVREALADWQLTPLLGRRLRKLSAGNRQRVGLAVALHHGPSLILLDEPGTALDPASIITLRDQLLQRAGEGAAIVVSSHHLDEVARTADRVLLINAGRLIGELDTTGPDLERAFFERIREDDEARSAPGPQAPEGSER